MAVWSEVAAVEQFVPLLIPFIWTMSEMLLVFLRSFTNSLILYLPGKRAVRDYEIGSAEQRRTKRNDQWRLSDEFN